MVKYFALAIVFSLICGTLALDINFSPALFFKHKENTRTYAKTIISSTTQVYQREFEQRFGAFDADQRIVFLIAEDLSPEDLSIKNEQNARGFENIASQVDIVEYIPYVENAVDNKITQGQNVARTSVSTTNELEPRPSSDAKIIVVSLPECDSESPFDCASRIDRASYAISQLEEYKDAIFVLTSEMNSKLEETHSRKARDTSAVQETNVFPSINALVYFTDLYERPKPSTKEEDKIVTVQTVTATKVGDNEIKIEFNTGSYLVVLGFQLDDADYWILNETKSSIRGEAVHLGLGIAMPREFSLSCTSGVYLEALKDDKIEAVYFKNLQIQLDASNSGENLKRFEDAYDCAGFTSPAIWAGLFITFLLLIIMSTGITWIMDIRTMDRFDDPKGKTITITASE